jgi:hypothetical protein
MFWETLSEILIFPTGFDLGGQVAIGISHWKSPFPPRGHPLCDSPDGVRSEASAATAPHLPEYQEPVSCPASLSINPISSHCSASQETISDSSTSKVSPFNFEPWLHSNLSSVVWSLKLQPRNGFILPKLRTFGVRGKLVLSCTEESILESHYSVNTPGLFHIISPSHDTHYLRLFWNYFCS